MNIMFLKDILILRIKLQIIPGQTEIKRLTSLKYKIWMKYNSTNKNKKKRIKRRITKEISKDE